MSNGGQVYEVRQALRALSLRLGEVRLPLRLPGVEDDRRRLEDLSGQLRDYVLPRMARPRAPLLAVLVGGTGVGRSSLLGGLVGEVVSEPGVRRPTTRTPVLVHHPADARWFSGGGAGGLLSSLARAPGSGGPDRPGVLHVVAKPGVPSGLGLIDAPDYVCAVPANRACARHLFAAADLVVFVTSPARYADDTQTAWLRAAAASGVACAVVLNRVRSGEAAEVRPDLADRMSRTWLEPPPLFVVEAAEPLSGGALPPAAVGPIRTWLAGLVGDPARRTAVVRQTLDGILRGIPDQVERIAAAVDAQAEAVTRFRLDVRKAYEEAVRHVDTAGSLTETEVPVVIAAAADRAEERVSAAWRSIPAGVALLKVERPVAVPSRTTPAGVAELMDVERRRYERVLDDLRLADPDALGLRPAAAAVEAETAGVAEPPGPGWGTG